MNSPEPEASEATLREAFKAGWRTNAIVPEADSTAYFDGCEQVDWLEYQRLGIAAYLASLIAEEIE